MNKKVKTIHINTILHKELKVFVAVLNESMQDFAEAAIRNEIDRRQAEVDKEK